jgi:predicted dehydrogenase
MARTGRRIGFVDYRLDNYHADVFLKILRKDLKKRGFEVAGCIALDEANGRAWARKKRVPYWDSLGRLNDAVDYYMVLAPSNPELHLPLCRMVFPFGKPAYVDKTFAPDLKTARKIFALAGRYGTKIQTTSALRYTNVQEYVRKVGREDVCHMAAWGGGRSFGEYAIHPVELVVSCMGAQATRLMRRGAGAQSQLLIDFSRGRTAVVNVYVGADTPFAASVTTDAGTRYLKVKDSQCFRDTAAAILDFFASGRPGIDRRETLMIRRILDAAQDPRALKGFVRL